MARSRPEPRAQSRTNPSFLNGVPELLILRLLEGREMYGYEIARGLREGPDASLRFGEGVIYPVLHALEKQRCLLSRRAEVNGRSRVYYRLSAKGRRRLKRLVDDWTRINDAIRLALEGGGDVSVSI